MAVLHLDGVINCRDFGGDVGAGGGRVRRDRLYRSGHHAAATPADLDCLAALDLALIVDLRRPPERLRDPARRPASSRARILEHQGPSLDAAPPHLAFLSDPEATAETAAAQMIIGYRGYPFDPHYVAVYRDYFATLANLEGPLMINCAAGKDRTGFLCALTLQVLGVGRDDIYADYLATNRHNRAEERLAEFTAQFQATHGRPVSEALIRRMLAVDPAYLDAAYGAIGEACGDIDQYLDGVVGLTPLMRDQIQSRFLI